MTRSRPLAALLVAVVALGFVISHADAAFATRADAPRATPLPSNCWADVSYPAHIGNNVETTITWQCNGIPAQIAPTASLELKYSSTRYTASRQCYNTSSCAVTVSGPWVSGTWKAKADYAYVDHGGGSSGYYWGTSVEWDLFY